MKKKLRGLSAGKIILAVIVLLIVWKVGSFYVIIYHILHPNWDEITLITSMDATSSRHDTEYTEDNGRAMAEEVLSGIRLGRPTIIGGLSSRMNVVELFTDSGSQRVVFIFTGGNDGDGYIIAEGEIKIRFHSGGKLWDLLYAADLDRTSDHKAPPSTEDFDYWIPNYR